MHTADYKNALPHTLWLKLGHGNKDKAEGTCGGKDGTDRAEEVRWPWARQEADVRRARRAGGPSPLLLSPVLAHPGQPHTPRTASARTSCSPCPGLDAGTGDQEPGSVAVRNRAAAVPEGLQTEEGRDGCPG